MLFPKVLKRALVIKKDEAFQSGPVHNRVISATALTTRDRNEALRPFSS